jgi:bla regulator protein blaR1
MIRADLWPVANHIWQSTLCAGVAWLLAAALRNNRAAVRYWVWLGASVKFLVPFSWFVGIGSNFSWRTAPALGPLQWPVVMEGVSSPVAGPVVPGDASGAAADALAAFLFAIWFCGFALGIVAWVRGWRATRAVRRRAIPLAIGLPIPALSCPASVEPGVFGIRRPVLLLPEGISDRLAPAQLDAVLVHEMCHVRRRDNLTGAIHLMVETIFWFHPLIWWIRTRLVEERERACDEAVLESGGEPRIYAEGILNVCRLYNRAPLVGVSGIGGSHLRRRIEDILSLRVGNELDWRRRVLLGIVAIGAVACPVALGLLDAPPVRAQSQARLTFEVASVKLNQSGDTRSPSMILPGGRFTATNNTVRALIQNAYSISESTSLEGGPGWIDSARYDIEAKAPAGAIPPGTSGRVLWEKTRLMLQTLLADRFQLSIRRQTREAPVYRLVVAKNGAKLQKSDRDCDASVTACHGFAGNPTRLSGTGVDLYDLALILSRYADRPVFDGTGISGIFDIKLQWNPFAGRPPVSNDAPRSPASDAREGPRPDLASLPTLSVALEQQLGLKLEATKGPIESYVIEHVERPSGN